MAHPAQQAFVLGVRERWPWHFSGTRVLEIGSYFVNGSIRDFFESPNYLGLDLAPGPGVDLVCHGADYDTEERFDVVISCECFEHNHRWRDTFENMVRLCRVGGLVVFTCASRNRPEHGTMRTSPQDSAVTTDYYRNLYVEDFERSFAMDELFGWYGWESRLQDLYFYGVKA